MFNSIYRTIGSVLGAAFLLVVVIVLIGCPQASNLDKLIGTHQGTVTDSDNDGVADTVDVDDDNDGLIDIRFLEDLDAIRHNPAGTSYNDGTGGSSEGAPTAATQECNVATAAGVYLCGYELTQDLDFADGDSYRSGVVNMDWLQDDDDASKLGFIPLVLDGIFSGVRGDSGGRYVIENLYVFVSGRASGGLFGRIGATGVVSNVELRDATVRGDGSGNLGGIAGENDGRIRLSVYRGAVLNTNTGAGETGGLVGRNSGTIESSVADAAVSRGGGLVGSNINGRISGSSWNNGMQTRPDGVSVAGPQFGIGSDDLDGDNVVASDGSETNRLADSAVSAADIEARITELAPAAGGPVISGDATQTIVTLTATLTGYDLAVEIAHGGRALTSDADVAVSLNGARTGVKTAVVGTNNVTLNATTTRATLMFNGLEPDSYTLAATAPDGITVNIGTATIAVAAPTLTAMPNRTDISSGADADITLTLNTLPLRDVAVTVAVDGITATRIVTFAAAAGSSLSETASFTTGTTGSPDISSTGTYNITLMVAPADRPLITLPASVSALVVIDSTQPILTITPIVTDNDLAVTIVVSARDIGAPESVRIALTGGSSAPAPQTISLVAGTAAGSSRTVSFANVAPASYTLEVTPLPGNVNIVYAGGIQTVVIAPLVTISHVLIEDDLAVTATVTEGPIGAGGVNILLSTGGATQTITLAANTPTNGTATYTFTNLPSGSYTLSATSTDSVRLAPIATPTFSVLPRVRLTLTSTTPGTATASAVVTGGTISGAGVVITAVIDGPGGATAMQALPLLSGGAGQTRSINFMGLQPGAYSLDSASITTPAGILLDIDTASVTVSAPTLSLAVPPGTKYFEMPLTVTVRADAPPSENVTVQVQATDPDGTNQTRTSTSAILTPGNYTSGVTVTINDLAVDTYTLTFVAGTGTGVVVVPSADTTVIISPVTVTLTTTPTSDDWPVEFDEDFLVTARVSSPAGYAGEVALTLSGIGAARTLNLSGTTAQTVDFGMLSVGDHTLTASGPAIAPINPIAFAVIDSTQPVLTITPTVTGNDLAVTVAVSERDIGAPESVRIALTGGSSAPAPQTISLTAGTAAGTERTVSFPDVAPASYTLEVTPSPGNVNIVYTGTTQTVVIAPLVTISHVLTEDDLAVTATVTAGPIGAGGVNILLATGGPTQTITLAANTPTNGTATYTFTNLPSGSYTLSATSADPVRIAPIATPTFSVLPRVRLMLSSTTAGTATATAVVTGGTISGAGVAITAVIDGPGGATAMQALPLLSGGVGQTRSINFTGLQPGAYSLDSASITTPAGIVLDIDTASVTVAAPTLSLTAPSGTQYFGVPLAVTVRADAQPAENVTVRVQAIDPDGTNQIRTSTAAILTPGNYNTGVTVVINNLAVDTYTLTFVDGTGTGVVAVPSTDSTVTISPVTVTLTTTPAPVDWPVAINQNFLVAAQVSSPADYTGGVTLTLSGIGAVRTLNLSGTTAQSVNFGILSGGDYSLMASGPGIAPIATTAFAVSISAELDVDDDDDGLIEINTLEDLDYIRYNLAGTSYKTGTTDAGSSVGCPDTGCNGYELARSLDFDSGASYAGGINAEWSSGTNGWTPIGDGGNQFTAIFEGNGNTISNLLIARASDYIGLFGFIGTGGRVRNLGLPTARVSYTGSGINTKYVGILSGWSQGTIVAVNTGGSANGGDRDEDHVGGLVGWNAGPITASYATGRADGGDGDRDTVGGLVGLNERSGTITASYATGSVDGGEGSSDNVGGLVGRNNNGPITASYATGSADGGDGVGDTVGGLVGWNVGGTITASYATGSVDGGEGSSDTVGGLVGWNAGPITASYATGGADGGDGDRDNVGGLVGLNDRFGGTIMASYATGSADGDGGRNDEVGGLVGKYNGGLITASYGFGTATGETTGVNRADDASDGATVPDAARITEANSSTTAANSWATQVWNFGTNMQTPALRWVTDDNFACDANLLPDGQTCGDIIPGQSRTIPAAQDVDDDNDGLIEINSLEDLDRVRLDLNGDGVHNDGINGIGHFGAVGAPTSEPSACDDGNAATTRLLCGYELARSLDFDSAASYAGGINAEWSSGPNGWLPLAHDTVDGNITDGFPIFDGTQFTAIFEGNGNTISNLLIARTSDYIGLFGSIGAGGRVRRLDVESARVTYTGSSNNENYVGILSGWSDGDIVAVNTGGSANGGDGNFDNVGGLVGVNDGPITTSYATGRVDGGDGDRDNVGGLVGRNLSDGTITASYASGSANGDTYNADHVGGLVGLNDGTITASYATGSVDGGEGSNDLAGGLVGVNDGTGTITTNYWDTTTSGWFLAVGDGSNIGATGLSMAQMQSTAGSFPDFAAFYGSQTNPFTLVNNCYPRLKTWTGAGADDTIGTADDAYSATLLPGQTGTPFCVASSDS